MVHEPPRRTTGRTFAKYSGTTGILSHQIYCQTSSSVQFESGNTRIDSPDWRRVLKSLHSSGRWLRGSQPCPFERNEKIRSLARLFSSSRRAPPIAASNSYLSSACLRASVFITRVWSDEPDAVGLTPRSTPSWLI